MTDDKQKQIDNEPFFFCMNCGSPKILTIDGIDYCDDCGSDSIHEGTIEEWLGSELKTRYDNSKKRKDSF